MSANSIRAGRKSRRTNAAAAPNDMPATVAPVVLNGNAVNLMFGFARPTHNVRRPVSLEVPWGINDIQRCE
jgi:hypothetical protein